MDLKEGEEIDLDVEHSDSENYDQNREYDEAIGEFQKEFKHQSKAVSNLLMNEEFIKFYEVKRY
jgi:predicted DNA-binding antitoxin AbrB/MazE fold protein